MSWEPVATKIDISIQAFMLKLNVIWEDMGLTEDIKTTRYEQVYNHFQDLMNEMLIESEHAKKVLLQTVQQLLREAEELSKELQTGVVIDGYENLPLTEVQTNLENQVQSLRRTKEQRLKYLKELLEKEYVICKSLGEQPVGIDTDLPTEEELKSFRLYLEKQEIEKCRLESIFKDMRQEIIKSMDELHVTPSLDFEQRVCNDYENFVFTANNMSNLRDLRDQLKDQVEEAKQQIEEKKRKLMALWKYLDEPPHLCEAFLNGYPGYSVTTLKAFNEEIIRCNEKRSENIAKYVNKIRTELENLWDLCKLSEAQRKEFSLFHCQTYTEDLLTLHELEAQRLRKYYDTNRVIFELLEERENLWEKAKELEQRAKDPDRFHNRGGQLLAEEKERKVIQKKVPKIEEQLNVFLKDYESVHGESFTINGIPLADVLKQSWEDYDNVKQTMKKARKQAKDQSSKKVPLSVSKRTPGMTSVPNTPSKSIKRKQSYDSTPTNLSAAKRRNLRSSDKNKDKNRPTVSGSKIRKGSRVSRRIFNHSGSKIAQSLKQSKGNTYTELQNVNSTNSSYKYFQEHLEQREELRSSVLPEQVLKNVNKSRMKTPVRTPVKPLRKNISASTTPNRTPKSTQTSRGTPRSPRFVNTPRLAVVPSNLPFLF